MGNTERRISATSVCVCVVCGMLSNHLRFELHAKKHEKTRRGQACSCVVGVSIAAEMRDAMDGWFGGGCLLLQGT